MYINIRKHKKFEHYCPHKVCKVAHWNDQYTIDVDNRELL